MTEETQETLPEKDDATADASKEVKTDAPVSEKTDEEKAAVDKEDTGKPDAGEQAAKPKKDSRQKRIAKLSYENRELNRRVDKLLNMVEKGQKTDEKPPKIENFETLEEFLDARDSYQKTQKKAPDKPDAGNDDVSHAIADLMEMGSDKYEDFEETVSSDDVKISAVMRDAILVLDDEMQVEVAYYLATHTKETNKISKLSPLRQVTEIGRLEARLSSKPTPKKPSKAPDPIKPVSGTRTKTDSHQPEDDMATFIKKRNKELGRK